MGDIDENIDTAEIEEEGWIGRMKRSTRQADENEGAVNVL